MGSRTAAVRRSGRPARRARWKTALAAVLTAVMLFPVYWMLNGSFTRDQDLRKVPPNLFPAPGTLEGYRMAFHDQLPYLATSAVVGLGTAAVTVAVAAPAGYALGRLRPAAGTAVRLLMLLAQMVPGIAVAMGLYVILLATGYLHSVPGLIAADSTLAVPFGVLVTAAFTSGLPNELLQAARTDGAGEIRTFWSIVLPLSRNALVTVALFAFLWAWSDFLFASTLDSEGAHRPVTLGIYRYIGNNNQQWNAIMATAALASVPTALMLVLVQRFIAAGVTAGAVED
jgi:multiple sugar transport system permease protein